MLFLKTGGGLKSAGRATVEKALQGPAAKRPSSAAITDNDFILTRALIGRALRNGTGGSTEFCLSIARLWQLRSVSASQEAYVAHSITIADSYREAWGWPTRGHAGARRGDINFRASEYVPLTGIPGELPTENGVPHTCGGQDTSTSVSKHVGHLLVLTNALLELSSKSLGVHGRQKEVDT